MNLNVLYFDPEFPGAYGGVEQFYREVKKKHPNITRTEIKDFLSNQDAYTLHKSVRKPKLGTTRQLSNNAQYIILMKNKRNLAQVLRLARQILGDDYNRVLDAYKWAIPRNVNYTLHKILA